MNFLPVKLGSTYYHFDRYTGLQLICVRITALQLLRRVAAIRCKLCLVLRTQMSSKSRIQLNFLG